MRKTTLSTALGFALSLGALQVAGAQTAAPAQGQPAAGAHARHDGARGERGMRGEKGPRGFLKGITLTADQKAKLKAEFSKKNPQEQALRTQMRDAMKQARDARQKGDSAAAKAAFARVQQLRTQAKPFQEQRLATLRSILTPEQQKQFDANVAQARQREAQRGERGKDGQGRHWRGARGDKGGR